MKKCQLETAKAANESHILHGTYPPKGFKIPNSELNYFKRGVTCRQRLGDKRENERIRKAAETRNATIRQERIRIAWGFEQRTRLKLTTNRKKILYRFALKKRGYLIGRGGSEAVVTASTIRSEIVEKRAREYGIRTVIP